MAYSSTVTVEVLASGNPEFDAIAGPLYLMTITETEAAATSEVTISMADPAGDGSAHALPEQGRIVYRTCALTAGTGTTIDPIIGEAADPSANSAWKFENGTAAADTHEQPAQPVAYSAETLYHRSVPNDATADHSIVTKYAIIAGWVNVA